MRLRSNFTLSQCVFTLDAAADADADTDADAAHVHNNNAHLSQKRFKSTKTH